MLLKGFSFACRLRHQDVGLTHQDAIAGAGQEQADALPWAMSLSRFIRAADRGIAHNCDTACLSHNREKAEVIYLQLLFYPAIHFLPAVLRYFYLCMQLMF